LFYRNSKSFVKKKAALCLLRLFRKHSDVLPATDWAEKILNIMDDTDLGVALSTSSLILALAQQYPDAYSGCVPRAVNRLHKVSFFPIFISFFSPICIAFLFFSPRLYFLLSICT